MIDIAVNVSDVLYKYLRTPDEIRVNGRWTLLFCRIAARRRSTIDGQTVSEARSRIQNFPEASNGRVNMRKLTLAQDGIGKR